MRTDVETVLESFVKNYCNALQQCEFERNN